MCTSQGHGTTACSPIVEPADGPRQQRVVRQFLNFPFSSDEGFQQGLSAILSHDLMGQLYDSEKSELIKKTKVFYFNRVTGNSISLEDIQSGDIADLSDVPAENRSECTQTCSERVQEGVHTLTFAELKNLIEQGKTESIPNNKIIPETLNNNPPSQSTATLRKKPWEITDSP